MSLGVRARQYFSDAALWERPPCARLRPGTRTPFPQQVCISSSGVSSRIHGLPRTPSPGSIRGLLLIPRLSTLLRTSLARPSCMRRWLARRRPSSPTSRRCGMISELLRTTLTQKRHNVDPIRVVRCTSRLTPILHAHWPELDRDARSPRSSRAAPGIKRWVEIPTGGGVTR